MAPLIRLIVINIVFPVVVIRLIAILIAIFFFFFINITFCSIICVGGKCIVITIIDLAREHQISCLISINICIIYIILG